MIHVREISKSYGNHAVLEQLNISLEPGTILTLFGPNGCGKTTALRIIAGLETPDRGLVSMPGAVSRQCSFVPQNYRASMLPWLSARENIVLPLELKGIKRKHRLERFDELSTNAPLNFNIDRPVHELSGGQAQLVALQRAAITRPRLLLLDEPSSALDQYMRQELLAYLLRLRSALALTVIIILHDLDDALYISDSLLLFRPENTSEKYLQLPIAGDQTDVDFLTRRDEIFRLAGLASIRTTRRKKMETPRSSNYSA
jgi:NitT/TauT family transport system ATP-binding protein